MSGRHPWVMAHLAVTFADWGKPADAEALYAELAARGRRSFVAPSWLALAAAAVGLEEETIRHAREACEIRDPISIAVFSKWWRSSARLRAYPRICEVLVGTELEYDLRKMHIAEHYDGHITLILSRDFREAQ